MVIGYNYSQIGYRASPLAVPIGVKVFRYMVNFCKDHVSDLHCVDVEMLRPKAACESESGQRTSVHGKEALLAGRLAVRSEGVEWIGEEGREIS